MKWELDLPGDQRIWLVGGIHDRARKQEKQKKQMRKGLDIINYK